MQDDTTAKQMGLSNENNLVAIESTHMKQYLHHQSELFEQTMIAMLGKICTKLNYLDEKVAVLEDFQQLANKLAANQDKMVVEQPRVD